MIFSKKIQNIVILLLFLLSTGFWMHQHAEVYSWDFSVYVMNAKNWVGNEGYYEHARAPVMPTMLGILSIFGWEAAEYLYIVLVSLLFLYSILTLGKSLKFNKLLLYSLSLNPFVLQYGMNVGTELLSLSLLILFTDGIIEGKSSGFFGGLASLARYQFVIFLPLVLFSRKLKDFILNITYFTIPWLIWLFFDRIISGHFLTSFANSYALNVKYRGYLHSPIDFSHFLKVGNYLIPLFLMGLLLVFIKIYLDRYNLKNKRTDLLFILITIISLYIYINTPLRILRYLFPLSLVIIYFSYKGLDWLKYKKMVYSTVCIIIIIFALASPIYLMYGTKEESTGIYEAAILELENLNKTDCVTRSNAWVPISSLGLTSLSAPRKELVEYYIKEGENIVLFPHAREPEYVLDKDFVDSFPRLSEKEGFIILGSRECKDKKGVEYDLTYTQSLNETIMLMHNKSIETNPCKILFDNLLGEVCDLFNFNQKRQDET